MNLQKDRLEQVRKRLTELDIEGLLVTNLTNVHYLTGFSGSAGTAFITGDRAFFHSDFRYQEQSKKEISGFEIVISNDIFYEVASSNQWFHGLKKIGFEAAHLSVSLHEKLRSQFPSVEWTCTENEVELIASIKDDHEIGLLKRAVEITDKTFDQLSEFIKPGMTELEIAAHLSYLIRVNGGDKDSFDPIVASGPNSALPHAKPSERQFQPGDFLILDFGALYKGYHADLTRTLIAGKPSKRHNEIYSIVKEAQQMGLKAAKAGITGKELDAIPRSYIRSKGYGEYFGHGLGHGLGLEVHTYPRLNDKNDKPLKSGMAVTIEPGIYIPDFGGVRIEDDVIIRDDHGEVLNTATRELIVIG